MARSTAAQQQWHYCFLHPVYSHNLSQSGTAAKLVQALRNIYHHEKLAI